MTRVVRCELFAVDLPLRRPFRHAAAERVFSSSVFLKCETDCGAVGFGETLPRDYVTGETRDEVMDFLHAHILPRLLELQFSSLLEVRDFLQECDGRAPAGWSPSEKPHTAAWAAVDLALLDAFAKSFDEPVRLAPGDTLPETFRYSAVLSADRPLEVLRALLKVRLFGIRQVKLKVGRAEDQRVVRLARWVLGPGTDIRVDANMAWSVDEGLARMRALAEAGVRCFEQPTKADDLSGSAQLLRDTGLAVMADESLTDRASLEALVQNRACSAVNVRIAKCGGLVAALNRCRQALDAGLTVQVGCQVGESSLLSAAQLLLVAAVQRVTFAEGCFGRHILCEDPARPCLQFGYGGRPPRILPRPGLGPTVDETLLARCTIRKVVVDNATAPREGHPEPCRSRSN